MITKEQLEELIKQGAMVYEAKYGNVNPVDFSKNKVRWVGKYCITLEPSLVERYGNHKYYKNLFETKEDAEWAIEFANITRPETLSLPTWKKFDEKKFVWFVDKNYHQCVLYYLNVADKIFINTDKEVIDMGELTKDNYIEACKMAKKLFLGG